MQEETKRVAVFIDAENISPKHVERIMAEASNYGNVIIRHAFADWSSPNMKSWTEAVTKFAIVAEQQFATVKGKNASDISLVVNVMKTLFERKIDVMCLASSDSDFTRLVQELCEREKYVVGFGLKNTIPAYVNTFSEFIYLDEKADDKAKQSPTGDILTKEKLAALREVIDGMIESDGRALFSNISKEMQNKFKDFNKKNYGNLKDFIKKNLGQIGKYEIETGKDGVTMSLVAR